MLVMGHSNPHFHTHFCSCSLLFFFRALLLFTASTIVTSTFAFLKNLTAQSLQDSPLWFMLSWKQTSGIINGFWRLV
uniref:Uncharacterized protein n=1 Tax=Salix viminalis TaxID=40686 RepID=A0A6N2L216_SALVM